MPKNRNLFIDLLYQLGPQDVYKAFSLRRRSKFRIVTTARESSAGASASLVARGRAGGEAVESYDRA